MGVTLDLMLLRLSAGQFTFRFYSPSLFSCIQDIAYRFVSYLATSVSNTMVRVYIGRLRFAEVALASLTL